MFESLLRKFRPGCRHQAVVKFDRWEHSESGHGFWVSKCRQCGTEMTQAGGGNWEAVPVKERP